MDGYAPQYHEGYGNPSYRFPSGRHFEQRYEDTFPFEEQMYRGYESPPPTHYPYGAQESQHLHKPQQRRAYHQPEYAHEEYYGGGYGNPRHGHYHAYHRGGDYAQRRGGQQVTPLPYEDPARYEARTVEQQQERLAYFEYMYHYHNAWAEYWRRNYHYYNNSWGGEAEQGYAGMNSQHATAGTTTAYGEWEEVADAEEEEEGTLQFTFASNWKLRKEREARERVAQAQDVRNLLKEQHRAQKEKEKERRAHFGAHYEDVRALESSLNASFDKRADVLSGMVTWPAVPLT